MCPVCKRWGYDMYYVHELNMCNECAEKAGYELIYGETNTWIKTFAIKFIDDQSGSIPAAREVDCKSMT